MATLKRLAMRVFLDPDDPVRQQYEDQQKRMVDVDHKLEDANTKAREKADDLEKEVNREREHVEAIASLIRGIRGGIDDERQ